MVCIPKDCITSENEANSKTDTCTSKCTDPGDKQKVRWLAGRFNRMQRDECDESSLHYNTRNKASGSAFDSRDLRGMNMMSTYFCRRQMVLVDAAWRPWGSRRWWRKLKC